MFRRNVEVLQKTEMQITAESMAILEIVLHFARSIDEFLLLNFCSTAARLYCCRRKFRLCRRRPAYAAALPRSVYESSIKGGRLYESSPNPARAQRQCLIAGDANVNLYRLVSKVGFRNRISKMSLSVI